MSIDSALIVRRTALPTAERLAADIAETGVTVAFPADFALDRNVGGWVPVTVDGQQSGFRFAVQSMAELDPAELPEGRVPTTLPAEMRPSAFSSPRSGLPTSPK